MILRWIRVFWDLRKGRCRKSWLHCRSNSRGQSRKNLNARRITIETQSFSLIGNYQVWIWLIMYRINCWGGASIIQILWLLTLSLYQLVLWRSWKFLGLPPWHNLQSKLIWSLLLRRMESRTKEEKVQALCRKLAHWKILWAFLLRKRLKRYNFKLYNQNGVETIYSPYAIFGIGMMELELKTLPSSICLAWPFGTSLEKAEDYPLDLSPYEDKTKVLVTCEPQLPWARRIC